MGVGGVVRAAAGVVGTMLGAWSILDDAGRPGSSSSVAELRRRGAVNEVWPEPIECPELDPPDPQDDVDTGVHALPDPPGGSHGA